MGVPRLKPPPPGPQYATRSDIMLLAEIQKAIDKRDFPTAKAMTERLSSPVSKSLGRWFYFYAEDPLVSLMDADAFLDTHPDWPGIAKIQSHVEKRITTNASSRSVLDFFETRDPVTGEGMLALARAEFAVGKADAGKVYVKEAWKRFNFTLQDEQRLIASYGRHLSVDDHIARADRLLWNREVTAARRVLHFLPAREKRMAEARAALLLGQENAATMFYSLKDDERLDSGVLAAAVRYFRRREEEPRAVTLAMQASTDPAALRNPVRWWEERQLLMRWALEEQRYEDAYNMAAAHGLEPGQQFAEAEFNAGWIALRFLNAPERAETHFAALAGSVGAPISLSRAYYWLGRAAESKGALDLANVRYREAARHIFTYYGQLAAERLGGDFLKVVFPPPVTPTPQDLARFSARPAVHALRVLSDMGDAKTFLTFSYHIDDQLETPGEYAELARLADRIGATHVKVRAGKVGVGRNAFVGDAVYPLVSIPEQARRYAPGEVILGISRQESEFNPRAYSSAGARGLMQLLPSTAEITAKKEGLKYSRAALLDDPEYNMTLGAAHLSHLFARYNQSRILTYVAYNAGPNRAVQWIERFGDPRSAGIDPVDWVELIPFQETRNYVQRVLENSQVYRARLNDAPIAGKLAGDIELGGAPKRAGLVPNRLFAGTLPPLPERTARFADAADLVDLDPPSPGPEPAPAETTPASGDLETGLPGSALDEADSADYLGDGPRLASTKPKGRLAVERAAEARANPTPTANQIPAPPRLAPSAATSPASPATNPPAMAPIRALEDKPPSTPRSVNALSSDASCQTYRDYIATTARENASAADLNSGMLAEARSGARACEEDPGGAPAPSPRN
jgi:soluble lytic murein transglycosylase